MQTKTVEYKGKKIAYRTKGSGPLIVLLHGFGEDGTVWRNQYDIFPNHQLIVPDLPGSGESEMIADMTMEGLADALKEAIASETVNNPLQCTLIGHSMGGYVALAFAEKYPDALAAFGLFHSTAFADTEEKRQTRRKGIAAIKENGAEAFLKTFVPNLYGPVTKEKSPQLITEHLAGVHNFSAEALVNYFEAMMARPDRTFVLREAKAPVLFVMGAYDKAVPPEDGLKQCHLPQLSYIHLLQNSGHMGMVEEAGEANKILIQFMNTVDNIA
jgi:pimeloyl-ACP methyl ester carboxylesterase